MTLMIADIDVVDKIQLGIDYNVEKWWTTAIGDLVKRENPMEMKDVERLGIDYVLKIATLRERVQADPYGRWIFQTGPRPSVGNIVIPASKIREVFNLGSREQA
jgi:hypothetical protein